MWTAGTFLFERMGTSNKIFVEFGVEHGLECNTYYLTSQMDWSGLMIEGNPAMYDRLRENLAPFPKVKTVQRFITKDNICETLEGMQVPQEFDLLSIDIDGNDYWVWQALHQYRPNAFFVREDLLKECGFEEQTPKRAYHSAGYGGSHGELGHPFRDGAHVKI